MNSEFDEKLLAFESIESQLAAESVEEKRDYSEERRMDMAEEGMALPDGSYPIANRSDLSNAIQAFGRAKDKEKAKAHIMKRARELEAEDMIPDNWKEKSDEDEIQEKAQAIMAMMNKPKGERSVFLSDIRFKEMEEEGELLTDEQYDVLSDEEKTMYERVNVMNEASKSGMGMRWKLREMMDGEEKGMGSDMKKPRSMFLTDVRFKKMMSSGELMDDESYSKLSSDEKGGCYKVDVYNESTKKGYGKFWRRRMPMERDMEVKKNEKSDTSVVETKSEDEFRCGIQQKSVNEVCDFCRGGCKSENGLPGLAEIEHMVKSAFPDAEIIDSGYSSAEDMFLVDVKRSDNDYIEVAYSGAGQQLGWFVIDPDFVEKRESSDIISVKDAESAAVSVVDGSIVGAFPDVFQDIDVYSVQIETSEKSYDVYVSLDGDVVGYDEYDLEVVSDDDEIKALEAELQIKRMYSREERMTMAENGDALPDGSFPIADKADLENAIQAFGRAADKQAAKVHIMKRAKELGLEEMIPSDWASEEEGESTGSGAQDSAEAMAESSEKSDDITLEDLEEFQKLLSDIGE